jgi:hypothetical protein
MAFVCYLGLTNLETSLYLRPLLNLAVERIAHCHLLGSLRRTLDKFVVDFFLDKGSRTGTAGLAMVKEQCKMTLLHGSIHCTSHIKPVSTVLTFKVKVHIYFYGATYTCSNQ